MNASLYHILNKKTKSAETLENQNGAIFIQSTLKCLKTVCQLNPCLNNNNNILYSVMAEALGNVKDKHTFYQYTYRSLQKLEINCANKRDLQ